MLGVDVCEFGGQVLELLWLTMCYRGLMAEKKDLSIEEEDDERNLNYKAPIQKSLDEIQKLDKDDESLVKYKQTLLGLLPITSDLSVPNVQVTRLTLLCDEVPGPLTMDLTGDLQALKEKTLVLKEGVMYRLKIDFKREYSRDLALKGKGDVQRMTKQLRERLTPLRFEDTCWTNCFTAVNREIVAGLKYHHVINRKGINVTKVSHMVGSYGPKAEEHEFVSPIDEAPKGMMSRGHYGVHSRFVDDDKNVYLDWEWNLDIKKDWD